MTHTTMLFTESELRELDGSTLEKRRNDMTDKELRIAKKVNGGFN